MDTLSDVLRAVRLSGAVLFVGEFSTPWSVWAPDSRLFAPMLIPGAKQLVLFHLIVEGTCWVELESESPCKLEAGDLIVLPDGDAHALANPPGETRTQMSTLLPPPPWQQPPSLVHGGGGEVARILCGFLYCDNAVFNPVFTMLPRVLLVRAKDGPSGSWLQTNVRYMLQEVGAQRPGGASLLARLTELLFVEVLRRSMENLSDNQIGWLAALKDPLESLAHQRIRPTPGRSPSSAAASGCPARSWRNAFGISSASPQCTTSSDGAFSSRRSSFATPTMVSPQSPLGWVTIPRQHSAGLSNDRQANRPQHGALGRVPHARPQRSFTTELELTCRLRPRRPRCILSGTRDPRATGSGARTRDRRAESLPPSVRWARSVRFGPRSWSPNR